MTEAMPFLQKAILLSYDPRPFGRGGLPFLFYRAKYPFSHNTCKQKFTVSSSNNAP